jgi:hypothetical protein
VNGKFVILLAGKHVLAADEMRVLTQAQGAAAIES